MLSNSTRGLNALACLAVCAILILAQAFEYYYYELPCPLCLLQRFGFLGIAFGFVLNAYDQPRPIHYAISLISALLTAAVGMRQVLLHIEPNTGAYGSPIWGLHLYTWSFLLASISIFVIAILLMNNNQFDADQRTVAYARKKMLYRLLFLLVMLLALVNAFTTFAICGISVCPDNPTQYLW